MNAFFSNNRNAKGRVLKPAPFQSAVKSGEVARVEPNKKWFGKWVCSSVLWSCKSWLNMLVALQEIQEWLVSHLYRHSKKRWEKFSKIHTRYNICKIIQTRIWWLCSCGVCGSCDRIPLDFPYSAVKGRLRGWTIMLCVVLCIHGHWVCIQFRYIICV